MNSKKWGKFVYPLSNFSSFRYFQTSLSLGVEQGLQKLPKFDINDLKFLFHCYVLIPRKCPRKTPFKTQCPPSPNITKSVQPKDLVLVLALQNFQTSRHLCVSVSGLYCKLETLFFLISHETI